jgi:hypothetical protein
VNGGWVISFVRHTRFGPKKEGIRGEEGDKREGEDREREENGRRGEKIEGKR